jgi:hypothetical protein
MDGACSTRRKNEKLLVCRRVQLEDGCKWEDNIKMDFKYDLFTGLIWLCIGIGGELLVFHKRQRISNYL